MDRIRNACPADVDPLVHLLEELGYPSDTKRVGLSLQDSTRNNGGVIVAEEADEVVGFASYQFVHFFEDAAPRCRLTAIVVDRRLRRAGIGRALLLEVEALALAAGCSAIEITSDQRNDRRAAHVFYRSLGYDDGAFRKAFFAKPLRGRR